MCAAIFVCGLALSGCRQDMHNQPKYIPLRQNDFYADQRASRDPVPGAIARGELKEDTYFYTGKRGVILGNELPAGITLNKDLLLRGQQRYKIFCTPCHSELGDGRGMIVQRGYKQPPSFHDERLRNAPLGHFFDVASNGFGAMPDYSAQIKPADRWAIAAYIRALQLSQHATEDDLKAVTQVNGQFPTESKEKSETMPHPEPAREGGRQ
jgi:mono/diheme cytochrome c family protein